MWDERWGIGNDHMDQKAQVSRNIENLQMDIKKLCKDAPP
jgi:hypothetical protein